MLGLGTDPAYRTARKYDPLYGLVVKTSGIPYVTSKTSDVWKREAPPSLSAEQVIPDRSGEQK